MRRPEFTHCFDNGRRYFSKHFVVFALERKAHEPWRVGLTVTRKSGHSPRRNRIKRVLREFFRLHQREFEVPYDLVIVPKRTLDTRNIGLCMVTNELVPVLRRMQGHSGQTDIPSAKE